MSLSPTLRFDVLRRDGFTCRYCGRKPPTVVLEVDHIHPKAAGGPDQEPNLVTACFTCNRGKRDRTGVLPAPTGDAVPAEYPVGMFFNLHRWALGWETLERSNNITAQGIVLAVQGDTAWCEVCDDEGFMDRVRGFPRGNWNGWDFFTESREMRFQWTYENYRAGVVPYIEVERWEEWDAKRFRDEGRLKAFYAKNPRFDPDPKKRVPYIL